MNNAKLLLLICGIVIAILTPAASVSGSGETIKIGGTGSGIGVMKLLGRAFERKYPGTKVEVLPSLGSSGGIKGVAKGVLDIAISSRLLKDEEKGHGLSVSSFAKTPFVAVTRRDTRATGLTTGDLLKIYDGRLLSWPDGRRIRLVLRPENDTDTHILKALSPEMKKAVEAAAARKGMLLGITDQDAVNIVKKTPGALGFSTLGQVASEKLPLKILSLDGIAPTLGAFSRGVYKLEKSLFIVARPQAGRKVADFLDFLRSPAGTKIVGESGYVVIHQEPVQ